MTPPVEALWRPSHRHSEHVGYAQHPSDSVLHISIMQGEDHEHACYPQAGSLQSDMQAATEAFWQIMQVQAAVVEDLQKQNEDVAKGGSPLAQQTVPDESATDRPISQVIPGLKCFLKSHGSIQQRIFHLHVGSLQLTIKLCEVGSQHNSAVKIEWIYAGFAFLIDTLTAEVDIFGIWDADSNWPISS